MKINNYKFKTLETCRKYCCRFLQFWKNVTNYWLGIILKIPFVTWKEIWQYLVAIKHVCNVMDFKLGEIDHFNKYSQDFCIFLINVLFCAKNARIKIKKKSCTRKSERFAIFLADSCSYHIYLIHTPVRIFPFKFVVEKWECSK